MPAGFAKTEQLLSGRSFSGFEIQEQLGAGGMGVVYRAVDSRLGRNVALKFLSSDDSMHGEARERFLREARAASALDHPHIGAVYGVEEGENGELCIVMAYYEGETVADRLARGRLSVSEALRTAIQAAEGLAEAHAANIVHRDVKPSNILLTRNGVRIVDFGLATSPSGGDAITQPRAVMGTAAYMSPEQARGLQASPRSDVWSLGAVLYEMLTGHRPFAGGSTFALLHSVVNHAPEPMDIGIPEVERLVLKALEKVPERRFGSMREFASALRRTLRELEVQSSNPTIPVAVSRSRGRKRGLRLWLVALAVVVAALAAMVAAGLFETKKTAVAILPFTAAEDSTAALARGLAESVSGRIAALERFEDSLAVIPTAELASRQIGDATRAHKAAGATVAIAGLLSRGVDGTLRLDLEFLDARTGEPVRSRVEDRTGDIAALEQRAAGQIAAMLDLRSAGQIRAAVPASRKSYEAYLRGLGYLQRWDKSGYPDQALAAFTEAVRDNRLFALAYVGLADASRTRFRAEKEPADIQHALNYARQALQIDSRLPDAHVALGRALQDSSQRDLAVLEFRKALEIDERHWPALLGMARAHEELGDAAEAEVAFRRAVTLSPYSWSARNNLASFYIRQYRFHDAEAQFRRALVLTPDNAPLLSNLGVVLSRQGRTREALEAFERSVAVAPGYAAHVNIGNIRYRRRQFRQAVAEYDKALQLNGKDFRVWGTKAQALRLAGAERSVVEAAYGEAIRLAEQALQASPGQPRTASLLAIYSACVGNRERAGRALEQALAQGGGDRDVLMDAAIAYEVLGERTQAIRWARTALAQGYSREEFRSDPDLASLSARL